MHPIYTIPSCLQQDSAVHAETAGGKDVFVSSWINVSVSSDSWCVFSFHVLELTPVQIKTCSQCILLSGVCSCPCIACWCLSYTVLFKRLFECSIHIRHAVSWRSIQRWAQELCLDSRTQDYLLYRWSARHRDGLSLNALKKWIYLPEYLEPFLAFEQFFFFTANCMKVI